MVRPATTGDIPWLTEQLKLFSDFYDTRIPLFESEGFVKDSLRKMVLDHVVLVAEKPEGLIGFIGGFLMPHTFNPKITCLTETFWWVAEEHRQSRAGYLLFKAFSNFGEENADWVLCTLEEKSPVNPNALLKRGYTLKERSFMMEVV